jgi:hypothetical protein
MTTTQLIESLLRIEAEHGPIPVRIESHKREDGLRSEPTRRVNVDDDCDEPGGQRCNNPYAKKRAVIS